jgi:hypothetical protein
VSKKLEFDKTAEITNTRVNKKNIFDKFWSTKFLLKLSSIKIISKTEEPITNSPNLNGPINKPLNVLPNKVTKRM